MPIPLTCPGCGLVLHAPDSHAGQPGRCNHCGARFMVPIPVAAIPPQRKASGCLSVSASAIGIALVGFIVLVAAIATLGPPKQGGSKPPAPPVDPKRDAIYNARQAVAAALGPRNADFPIDPEEYTVIDLEDGRFIVRGYVDTVNDSNAPVRRRWVVTIRDVPPDHFQVETFKLID